MLLIGGVPSSKLVHYDRWLSAELGKLSAARQKALLLAEVSRHKRTQPLFAASSLDKLVTGFEDDPETWSEPLLESFSIWLQSPEAREELLGDLNPFEGTFHFYVPALRACRVSPSIVSRAADMMASPDEGTATAGACIVMGVMTLMQSQDPHDSGVRTAGQSALRRLVERVGGRSDVRTSLSRLLTRQDPGRIALCLQAARHLSSGEKREVLEWLAEGGGLTVSADENRKLLSAFECADPEKDVSAIAERGARSAAAHPMDGKPAAQEGPE